MKRIINNETSQERFQRLATQRTNEVLKRLKILGNCSNRQIYEYNEKEINTIFSAIERKMKEVRSKFYIKNEEKFRL